MGGTHKKKLRAEKAKVKLKGAKLPKGLNVTKTDFKVRKITIREQLKEHQYVDGQRQLNLKEVLSRLKHHSVNFRVEALRHLREAITAVRTVGLAAHMKELLQGIVSNCLDMDRDARRECFKTLNALLSTMSAAAVAPFFHVISSYLRCAMTHIQPALQEDSLLLLDVLLQHVPSLVAEHNAKIFQNFLEMISRVRSEGDRAGRTLTVHMGQKQTAVKWRTRVLERLQQMMRILVAHQRPSASPQCSGSSAGSQCQLRTFNPKVPQHYALKRLCASGAFCDLSAIFCRAALAADGDSDADKTHLLRSYMDHLMPLLLEAWLEVRPPQQQQQAEQVLLTHDAARTLKVILEIAEHLWCLVEVHERATQTSELSDWFQAQHAQAFAVNFLSPDVFPYQQLEQRDTAEVSKKSKKSTTISTPAEQFCVPQNICLAYVMCQFHSTPQLLHQQSAKFALLLEYLQKVVADLDTYAPPDYRHLTLALRAFLLQQAPQLLQLHAEPMRALLRTTMQALLGNEFPHKDGVAAEVLVLLCDIAQTPSLQADFGAAEFVTFLEHLPQLLLKPAVSMAALIAMSNLGKQQNAIFLRALAQQVEPVIENVQRMQVVGANNAFEGKKYIMNLFYWTEKAWSAEERERLMAKIDERITDKRIISYYKFVLA